MDIKIETNIAVNNLDDACRVCLAADDSNQLIFHDEDAEGSKADERPTLSEKIKLYGGIEVSFMISFFSESNNVSLFIERTFIHILFRGY